ncbi:hypothetical protein [Paenibacillus sp. GP183]|uniref:hypothetical protein n=1 Tax=Paenibacillus sp. GP183 TaxID=1882751 RepID=UPI000B858697|nr:hypothetical protein [Paenibacillus sp. GP183]
MDILDDFYKLVISVSMYFFGAQMFRFSLRQHWKKLLAAALLTSCFDFFTDKMGWDDVRPFLSLILQAALVHIIFRISKWHALIFAFFSITTYTLLLGLIFFTYHLMSGVSYYQIFFELKNMPLIKLFTLILMWLLIGTMAKYRRGFTFLSEQRGSKKSGKLENKFTLAFILSLLVFSFAYYALMIQINNLLWITVGILISLIVLLLFLYNKEMEED